jgi:glycosyltransferase involved in cell wall biosynthesis
MIRLALQQRVLPAYRVPFFDTLATTWEGGLSVFAGQPCRGESIVTTDHLQVARYIPAHNRHWLTPSSPFYLCWQDGLLHWLEVEQPDALIVEANPRYRSTPTAIRWMHTHGRPVIGWGLGAPASRGALAAWRDRGWPRFLKQFDALIAYSQGGAEQYRGRGIPAERIFVALNAATPRPVAPPPPRLPTFDGPPTVLFVGRLQTRKRIDNLLHACAALPLHLQPRLWVVGDGPARQEYETLAQAIYPKAEFPGEQVGAELEAYFATADLFVLPGTGGLAVQQAMAHGLPVSAAEGDGTLDDLVRPDNGWRVPPGDLPALTEALRIALSDVSRLRRMGQESYRIVAEEVNLEAMVAVFLRVLRIVMKG